MYQFGILKCVHLSAGFVISAAAAAMGAAQAPATRPATAPLPQAIASFGAAADGGWLYVLGGHIGEQHQHSTANLSSLFMRLNLLDRSSWEVLPGSVGLQSVSLAAHEGRLYRIGGMRALNGPGEAEDLRSVDEVSRFDPIQQKWSALPALPEPRSSHDAAVYQGRLYVAGGWTLSGQSRNAKWIKTAWVMDLKSNEPEWQPLPEQPFERRAVGIAAAGGRLYVLGGIQPDGKPSQQVDVLDLAANRWFRGPDLPGNGFGIAALSLEDRILASGLDGKLYCLSEDQQSWRAVDTLSFPRIFHRLVAIGGNELLAVGGAGKGGHLRVLESLNRSAEGNGPELQQWTLPWPGQARNRQGMFLNRTELTFFGGNNSLEQHDFDPENFVDQGLSFNLGSLSTGRRPAFPARRQSMVTVMVNGTGRAVGYALGGFGHDGEAARSFDDIYRYDVADRKWSTVSCKLPAPLTQFGVATRRSELWLLGGLDYDPRRAKEDRFRHSNRVFVWDTLDEQAGFRPVEAHLEQPRRAFGCATLGERVYVVGGMRENFKLIETCEVLDLATRKIGRIPPPRAARISPELVALAGRLYLIGGSSPDADGEIVPNESIEVFDPVAQRWSVLLERLPIPSKHLRAFELHDQIVLVSTHDEGHVLRVALLRPRASDGGEISRR